MRGVLTWDGKKSHHVSSLLLPHLLQIWKKRTTENYLRRVVSGYNQNALESLNQLIWINTTKHKFHGYNRVYIAVVLALLRFELGPSGYLLVQRHLGLPVTSDQLENAMDSKRIRIFHAQRKAKLARKLFDETVKDAQERNAAAAAAEDGPNDGYCTGGCEVPAPSGLNATTTNYEGSFVAICYPGGVDVALCTNDEGAEAEIVSVSYYEKSLGGYYTPYNPPYEEKAARSRILSKLSYPVPKGTRTMRELILLKFCDKEMNEAKDLWRAKSRR